MQTGTIIEERITFTGEAGRLCGILAYPSTGQPRRAVLICAPHPHFAGDMDNNVVRTVARELATDSLTLRFDYRGVGDSELELPPGQSVFDYWSDIEEEHRYGDASADAAAALTQLQTGGPDPARPLFVAGYSFGVLTGLHAGRNHGAVHGLVAIAPPLGRVDFSTLADLTQPSLWILGRADFLFTDDAAAALRSCVGPAARWDLREHSDHFFRDEEAALARDIRNYLDTFGGHPW